MKTIKLFSVLIFFPLLVNAQAVNAVFTYQGELVVNGSPANGTYDMSFDAYEVAAGGSSLLLFGADIHTGVVVTNGVFTVSDVDFGNLVFSGGADTWLELAVKPTSSGSYNTLSPRQKITAAPYAVKADFANNATNATTANDLSVTANANDVLVYDGTNWKSGGNKIRVSNVGVSIGTTSIPPSNGLRVGGALEVDGIGSTVALDVDSDGAGAQDDPLRIRKNGTVKFYVDSNGGASVGSWATPEPNGLRVNGNTTLNSELLVNGNTTVDSELLVKGKAKQNFASKGMPKYMMHVGCFKNGSALLNPVNNTERTAAGTGLFAITINFDGTCGIAFPDVLDLNNYWISSATFDNTTATCRIDGVFSGRPALRCEVRSTDTGVLIDGEFMLIVY